MNDVLSLAQVQRSLLLRSIYLLLAPAMLLFAALACGTVVTDSPYYSCPTAVPQPTATTLPGTPPPTQPPPPTPYAIHSPQDFYLGDAVFVGPQGAPLRLRFRLQNVRSLPAPPLGSSPRNLVTWGLEIRNLGSVSYETIPVALMIITQVGTTAGTWRTSEAAMKAAGFTSEKYDPLTPGSTRIYRLAAYIPAGHVQQFAYLLDGEGGNRITWTNAANPYCTGAVAD